MNDFSHFRKPYLLLSSLIFIMTIISSSLIVAGLVPVFWLSFGHIVSFKAFVVICIGSFFLFGYLIDRQIAPISEFVTRAIITRRRSLLDVYILAVLLLLLAAFGTYSFTMSKDSADVAGINSLDVGAMFTKRAQKSDNYRVKLDSIRQKFDAETDDMLSYYVESIKVDEGRIKSLSKIKDRRVRDSLNLLYSSSISALNKEKIALLKQRDSIFNIQSSELQNEWGKEQDLVDGEEQAVKYRSVVMSYAKRFSFLAGWSIIIVALCASVREAMLFAMKKTHKDVLTGTMAEIPFNFVLVFRHNCINISRYVLSKLIFSKKNPLNLP